jgi:hypothetical protein
MLVINRAIIIALNFFKYIGELEQQPEANEPQQKHLCSYHIFIVVNSET